METTSAIIAHAPDGHRLELTIQEAEQLIQTLQVQVAAAGGEMPRYIELVDGRLAWQNLDDYFGRIYTQQRFVHFWSKKLMRKLLREWAWQRMKLNVWCLYCDKFVDPNETCVAKLNGHTFGNALTLSIDAQSIVRERGKFVLGQNEGVTMAMNFNRLIQSLERMCE